MELSLMCGEKVFLSLWDPEKQRMIYYASDPELLEGEDKAKFYTNISQGPEEEKTPPQSSSNQDPANKASNSSDQ